jgi:hypothetical protein
MIRLLLFLLIFSVPASAGLVNNAELDLNSRYVWRGIPYSTGSVAQPYLSAALGDLKVGLWANHDLEPPAGQSNLNEVDLYLSTSKEWGSLTITPLLQLYNYPQGANNTGELTLRISYPLGPVNVFGVQNLDVVKYPGSNYSELGAALNLDLRAGVSVTPQIFAGWGSQKFNETYLAVSKSAFNLVGAECSLSFSLNESVYIRPHLYYSSIQDPDLRQVLTAPDILCGGVAVGGEF